MVEILGNTSPENKENVLDESRQDLSYLKKEVENEENLGFSEKIPPKLKDIYKKLLKINSKKDIKNLELTGKELEILFNLFQAYSNTKIGKRVVENLKDVFDAKETQGSMFIYQEKFNGLKLITFAIGGKELFSINHTVQTSIYLSWKLGNMPVVVDRSSDSCYLKDIEGNKLEGWVSIMPDGNLMPIDENGVFDQQTFLFWNLSFNKGIDGDFSIDATRSPEAMLTYMYTKKKEKIGWMAYINSLENMGYNLEWNDNNRTVKLVKTPIKSKASEYLLSYKTDKDFLKWAEDAKKSIDSGVMEIEKQEAKFEDFYNTYFNASGTYIENMRYEIVRDQGTKFYLVDKHNRNKKLTNTSVSIFDERGRLLEGRDVDAMIEKYEAEQIYLKFIAKNNNKDAVNLKGEHVDNSYYIGYPFIYKSHTITLERTPFTDWKYAILVKEKETEKFIGKIALDNFMTASDIEKEINKLIK